jgi:flagellar assembly factor FliW
MKIQTSRFGAMEVADQNLIQIPEGLLGFEDLQKYFIVDPFDDTMILWLQSVDRPEIAFPVLEPKVFRPDYHVRLSANELRLLRIESISRGDTLVYSILTIPEDPRNMTANLKAPVVINVKESLGRQVVLQENEYSIKCAMYKELLALILSAAQRPSGAAKQEKGEGIHATPLLLTEVKSQVEVSPL